MAKCVAREQVIGCSLATYHSLAARGQSVSFISNAGGGAFGR